MENASSCAPGRGESSRANYEQGLQLAISCESSRGSTVVDRFGRRQNVPLPSSLQRDEVKHKLFISHSGGQKDFAEQLCVDLERRGFLRPFFDQRQHSLPKGKDFVPLIKDAARQCQVAVIVLSEDFLCSKWPMIELAEFHGAQQAGNPGLLMLPLFYKLSAHDLDEWAIEKRWMPRWRQIMADGDTRNDVAKWRGAVRELRKINGVVFGQKGPSEVAYREDIVQCIFSSLQRDEVKHKLFISHSGAQKDFAEQLCVDLERRGFLRPFFDQRQHSLPKGKDLVRLIKDAARQCQVALIVLSEEFLCSKWPMIELAEFHGAQQAGNPGLLMLPLFYKLSPEDLNEEAIHERWMPRWRQIMADGDTGNDVAKWSGAVRELRKIHGVVFRHMGLSEVAYREEIVQGIFTLTSPDLLYGSSRKMVGYSRVCEVDDESDVGEFELLGWWNNEHY